MEKRELTDRLRSKLNYPVPQIKLLLLQEDTNIRNKPVCICAPSDVAEFLEPLQHAAEELFLAIHLNAKSEIMGLHEVSHGTLSSSLVHPREVFKAAILANSFAIIVCHNHPSGSAISASTEDIDTTKQLVEAGKLMGISVIDHLIVGPSSKEDCYSIRENHPTIWS
jgi:DNA repair protein RadC